MNTRSGAKRRRGDGGVPTDEQRPRGDGGVPMDEQDETTSSAMHNDSDGKNESTDERSIRTQAESDENRTIARDNLTCPVCLNFMLGTILRCGSDRRREGTKSPNPHPICLDCWKTMKANEDNPNCPICRTEMPHSPLRFVRLEEMARTHIFTCPSTNCDTVGTGETMAKHLLTECDEHLRRCANCSKERSKNGIARHCRRRHTLTQWGEGKSYESTNHAVGENYCNPIIHDEKVYFVSIRQEKQRNGQTSLAIRVSSFLGEAIKCSLNIHHGQSMSRVETVTSQVVQNVQRPTPATGTIIAHLEENEYWKFTLSWV